MRRLLLLIDRRIPEIDFLTSTEAPSLLSAAGFPVFKLPSKTQIRASGLDVTEFKRLAKHFIWNTLGCFDCDLLVVDTFPQGSFDELLQLLDGPFKKSLILRQVKDEFAARPVFRAAISLYDQLVVPHDPATWTPQNGLRASFGGEVMGVERSEAFDHKGLCKRFGFDENRPVVYVSAGGGGDEKAEELLDRILNVVLAQSDWQVLVGAGPLYRGRRRFGKNLCWYTETGLSPYLMGCNFAISAAGYNSFNELLHLGVPSIFYAQPKIADDQAERIENAAKAGACLVWDSHFQDQLPALCEEALKNADALSAAARAYRPTNGAKRCAELALAPIEAPERLAWASNLCTGRLARLLDRSSPETAAAIARTLFQIAPPSQNDLERSIAEQLCNRLHQRCPSIAPEILAEALSSAPQMSQASLADAFCTLCETCEQRLDLESLCECLLMILRKQPPLASESPNEWISSILQAITHLLDHPDFSTSQLQDRLQLLRVFPKLPELDAKSALNLAERYLTAHQSEPAHVQLKALQVLKITHRHLDAELIESLCETPQ